MCEFASNFWSSLGELNWLGISQFLIALWVAVTAHRALNTWKKQARAGREIRFLEEFTEAVSELHRCLQGPITHFGHIRIGIDCHKHVVNPKGGFYEDDFRAYVELQGEEDAVRLRQSLADCSNAFDKVQSLGAKGETMGFKNYKDCSNSCSLIMHQYNRLQSVAHVIGWKSKNWENPKVIESNDSVKSLSLEKVRGELDAGYRGFLQFAKNSYEILLN